MITDKGVSYGISEGWLVNKEITPATYSGRLPFGLKWREKREAAERKILAVTHGSPELFKGGNAGFDQTMGFGVCLLTKNGHEYGLELFFDKDIGLSKIIGAILYP